MTRAEKHLKLHPDVVQKDGIPYGKPYEIVCVQNAGFDVVCCWQSNFNRAYYCVDCWNEGVEE